MQESKVVERATRTRTKNPERVEKAREAKRIQKRATKERAEDRGGSACLNTCLSTSRDTKQFPGRGRVWIPQGSRFQAAHSSMETRCVWA